MEGRVELGVRDAGRERGTEGGGRERERVRVGHYKLHSIILVIHNQDPNIKREQRKHVGERFGGQHLWVTSDYLIMGRGLRRLLNLTEVSSTARG